MIVIVFTEQHSISELEMGIREVLTAPRCPWQNAYAERLIASLGVRHQPGWIIFSLDGRYAYPSDRRDFRAL